MSRAGSGGSAQGGTSEGGAPLGGASTAGSPSNDAGAGTSSGGAGTGGVATGGAATAGSGGSVSGAGGSVVGGAGGSAGRPGVGGTGGKASCVDPDGGSDRERATAKGMNGSFTDACNAENNLTEYICEVRTLPEPCMLEPSSDAAPPQDGERILPPLCTALTGQVVPVAVDCGGLCREGTCHWWCPAQEDQVRFTGIQDGHVLIENAVSDAQYDCQVTFQREGHECAAAELVGTTTRVSSLGTCSASSVVLGTDSADDAALQDCTYTCILAK